MVALRGCVIVLVALRGHVIVMRGHGAGAGVWER